MNLVKTENGYNYLYGDASLIKRKRHCLRNCNSYYRDHQMKYRKCSVLKKMWISWFVVMK